MFQRHLSRINRIGPTVSELTEARFKRFMREMEAYEQKLIFERTLDAFLDVYSSWKKTYAQTLKIRLVMLAFELHRLDNTFVCELSFKDPS